MKEATNFIYRIPSIDCRYSSREGMELNCSFSLSWEKTGLNKSLSQDKVWKGKTGNYSDETC